MSGLKCPLCKGAIVKGKHTCPVLLQAQQEQLQKDRGSGAGGDASGTGSDTAVSISPVAAPSVAVSNTSFASQADGSVYADPAGDGSPLEVGATVVVQGLTTQREVNGSEGRIVGLHAVADKTAGPDTIGRGRRVVVSVVKDGAPATVSFRPANVRVTKESDLAAAAGHSLITIGDCAEVVGLLNDTSLNGRVGRITGKQLNNDDVICAVVTFPAATGAGRMLLHPKNFVPRSPARNGQAPTPTDPPDSARSSDAAAAAAALVTPLSQGSAAVTSGSSRAESPETSASDVAAQKAPQAPTLPRSSSCVENIPLGPLQGGGEEAAAASAAAAAAAASSSAPETDPLIPTPKPKPGGPVRVGGRRRRFSSIHSTATVTPGTSPADAALEVPAAPPAPEPAPATKGDDGESGAVAEAAPRPSFSFVSAAPLASAGDESDDTTTDSSEISSDTDSGSDADAETAAASPGAEAAKAAAAAAAAAAEAEAASAAAEAEAEAEAEAAVAAAAASLEEARAAADAAFARRQAAADAEVAEAAKPVLARVACLEEEADAREAAGEEAAPPSPPQTAAAIAEEGELCPHSFWDEAAEEACAERLALYGALQGRAREEAVAAASRDAEAHAARTETLARRAAEGRAALEEVEGGLQRMRAEVDEWEAEGNTCGEQASLESEAADVKVDLLRLGEEEAALSEQVAALKARVAEKKAEVAAKAAEAEASEASRATFADEAAGHKAAAARHEKAGAKLRKALAATQTRVAVARAAAEARQEQQAELEKKAAAAEEETKEERKRLMWRNKVKYVSRKVLARESDGVSEKAVLCVRKLEAAKDEIEALRRHTGRMRGEMCERAMHPDSHADVEELQVQKKQAVDVRRFKDAKAIQERILHIKEEREAVANLETQIDANSQAIDTLEAGLPALRAATRDANEEAARQPLFRHMYAAHLDTHVLTSLGQPELLQSRRTLSDLHLKLHIMEHELSDDVVFDITETAAQKWKETIETTKP